MNQSFSVSMALLAGWLLMAAGAQAQQNTRSAPARSAPDAAQMEKQYKQVQMGNHQNREKKKKKFKAAPTRNMVLEAKREDRRKMEKEMMKPQYSNPLYFGHKKPPKKRPPGKQKLCKECGMKH